MALCPSGADIVIDPDPIGDPADTIQIPVVSILTQGLPDTVHNYQDGNHRFFSAENTGSPHTSYTFDVDGTTVKTGGTESPITKLTKCKFCSKWFNII